MRTTTRWTVMMAAGVAGMAIGCSPPPPNGPVPTLLSSMEGARIVDLSHPFGPETLYWPTSPTRWELARLSFGRTEGGYFYSANAFTAPEHGGTHIDAPIHFAENGWTLADIPLDRLIGPGAVIDVTTQASEDPDYRLTLEDLDGWEAEHGTLPPEAIVLLRTGWDRFWPDAKRYLGSDTPGDASHLHFPSYGVEAARWLVEERSVAVLGIDTASIDVGASRDFMVHRVANGANVAALENVTGLDALPARGFVVFALPMKIAGGSGGPVRIVALLPGSPGPE